MWHICIKKKKKSNQEIMKRKKNTKQPLVVKTEF
jgi:hypothetical protein